MSPPILTDRVALSRNRNRAARMAEPAMFLHEQAALEVQERLTLVNRSFKTPAIVTGFGDQWRNVADWTAQAADDDTLDLQQNAHDLVVHGLSLHWANDVVGQLVQARRALRPDGLFLGVMFGGQTLHELRAVLAQAESEVTGGLSPRIAPMAEIRDLGGLLQRSGLALPVADSFTQTVRYKSMLHLMRDLRAMGEANALDQRNRKPLARAVLARAEQLYGEHFARDGGIIATFEFIFLTGWAPDASQPEPLRPGSAQTRLADALKTTETPVPDLARPNRV
jgi:SAM-dependent methyltransferase